MLGPAFGADDEIDGTILQMKPLARQHLGLHAHQLTGFGCGASGQGLSAV
jgi:hypothetical protein